jgi:hypothetical protein
LLGSRLGLVGLAGRRVGLGARLGLGSWLGLERRLGMGPRLGGGSGARAALLPALPGLLIIVIEL